MAKIMALYGPNHEWRKISPKSRQKTDNGKVEAKKAETDALRVYGERGGQTSVVATGAPVTPAPSPARILTPAYLHVRRRPP